MTATDGDRLASIRQWVESNKGARGERGAEVSTELFLLSLIDDAVKLLDYALIICMYGERAPGGNENWRDFGQNTDWFLRRVKGHEAAAPQAKEKEDSAVPVVDLGGV